jgi:hypothetical protein
VRYGQFKLPLLKEELVSDTTQLGVERSTLNAVFTGARSQGVEVQYSDKTFRVMGMLSDGLNALSTGFDSTREADFALTARGEWLWAGEDFKRFDDFAGWRGKAYSGTLGGALHFQDGGETAATTDESTLVYTVDAAAKGDGWSAFAALVGRHVEPSAGASFDDFGVLLQGGYFVTDSTELFARYSHIIPDDSRSAGEDFKEVTIGAAYYPFAESSAVKFTADLTIGLDDQASASSVVRPSTSNGLLSSGDEQHYFRMQATFVF